MRVRLETIVFDAGTQIRAAIDPHVVTEYADAMTEGAIFPPIVLFHDGTQHYLADGFHRFLAAQRNQCVDLDADVKAGTKQDALWFALGANKTNGKRLTEADKTHAIEIARRMWPEKMQREIATHVGCDRSLVSRVYQRVTSSEPVSTGRLRQTEIKRDRVRKLAAAGATVDAILAQVPVSRTTVASVRAEIGLGPSVRLDQSKTGLQQRRNRMRVMAGEGYTSRQIAAEVGLSEEGCRNALRKEQITVPGDQATRGTHRPEPNRIVDQIVMDAENLTEGLSLVNFNDLDRARLVDWLASLTQSRDKLGVFIRRLMKEQQKHGEAA